MFIKYNRIRWVLLRSRTFTADYRFCCVAGGFGCPKNAFACTNNKCVLDNMKCDGKDDCGDGSDEEDGCKGRVLLF